MISMENAVAVTPQCPFPHVERCFVVDDTERTGRFLICRWTSMSQPGRSHEVVAESINEHEAHTIARALASSS